jgi:hypothetical protein
MDERSDPSACFQPASVFTKSCATVKKVFTMSSGKHYDVFPTTS